MRFVLWSWLVARKDEIEGARTTAGAGSGILAFLKKTEGGCSVELVKKAMVTFNEHDRPKKFSAWLVRSDITRPLVPRAEGKIYGHATTEELQADLRLVGISAIPDDWGFLKETLRTAPGLLVAVLALKS